MAYLGLQGTPLGLQGTPLGLQGTPLILADITLVNLFLFIKIYCQFISNSREVYVHALEQNNKLPLQGGKF